VHEAKNLDLFLLYPKYEKIRQIRHKELSCAVDQARPAPIRQLAETFRGNLDYGGYLSGRILIVKLSDVSNRFIKVL